MDAADGCGRKKKCREPQADLGGGERCEFFPGDDADIVIEAADRFDLPIGGLGDFFDPVAADGAGCRMPPDELGADIDVRFIDLAGRREAAQDRATPFDEEVGHLARAEFFEEIIDHADPVIGVTAEDFGPGGDQRHERFRRGRLGDDDQKWGIVERSHEVAVDGRDTFAGEDDPQRRPAKHSRVKVVNVQLLRVGLRLIDILGEPGGERRVIGQRGAAADEDCVDFGAGAVDFVAGELAADPLAVAGDGRDAAIERHRPFGDDPRATSGDAFQVGCQEMLGGIGFDPDIDADAGLFQFAQAPAGDVGEGVTDGDDDAGQAGFDQRTGAGGGLTGVAAGFERHVGGSAAGEFAIGELLERIDLGMRPAEAAMATLGQEFAVANQDAPDHRVRLDRPAAPEGQPQRHRHPVCIGMGRVHTIGPFERMVRKCFW